MRKISLYLSLLLVLPSLAFWAPGCFKDSTLEPISNQNQAEKSFTHSVQDYAQYHNTEVKRLLRLDHETGCLSGDILQECPSLLQEMRTRNQEMAVSEDRFLESQKLLPTLSNLHKRGFRPQEVFHLMQICQADFFERTNIHPGISAGLDQAVRHLLARDIDQLGTCLTNLQVLTDTIGSEDEKSAVGIFLGSFEMSQQITRLPWYWPYVVMLDYVGCISGGPNYGSWLSAWITSYFENMPDSFNP